jgi:hypothetical protein
LVWFETEKVCSDRQELVTRQRQIDTPSAT